MANDLGYYNPNFYAEEGLIVLETALAIAGQLYRGYDQEYGAAREKGEFINIRKPANFAAQDAPSSAQDIDTDSIQLQLAYWREVKFKLTDKEHAFNGDRIVQDHIRPAVYALARDINSKAALLALQSPHHVVVPASGSMTVNHITEAKAIQEKLGAYFNDGNSMCVLHSDHMADLLNLAAFSQWQGSGSMGQETQRTGMLGERYGYRFASDPQITSKAAGGTAPTSVTLNGNHAKHATSIVIAGTGGSGTCLAGTVVTVGGTAPENKYAVTANVTYATAMTIAITPPLRAAVTTGAAITFEENGATSFESLMFHRNFAAIAFGMLPQELPRQLGAQIATATDEKTGLSMRSRIYYVGNSSEIHVALDVLYGLRVLDPDLAVRMNR
jgi:hypothetical protein